MNKKAGEKYMSIWWFVILITVGLAVVLGVSAFYSAEKDVRYSEAVILSEKISECIINRGMLKTEVLKESYNIYKNCNLDESVFNSRSNFFFKVEIGSLKEIKGVDTSFESDCGITSVGKASVKAPHLPKCFRENFKINYFDGNEIKEIIVKIITASNQGGDVNYE